MEPTQIETQASIAATARPPAAAERADDGEPSVDLEDPSLYYNRELSWLDFNDRVLQLAEDSSVPLLERIKFCAIWESNLDEFFMVRVANLHDQVELGRDARGADGLSADEQIDAIADVVAAQRDRMARCFSGELVPSLAEHGIRFISVADASEEERREMERLYAARIFPALTPLVIGLGRPFPYISNLSLSLAVIVRDPDQGTEVLARVKVPKELLGRFVRLGSDGAPFVPLEDLIAANLDSLFPGMEIVDHALFRVTRDTDYDVSDEADDLLEAVEEELRRRRFGEVVRLEVESAMSPRIRGQLVEALRISERQVYAAPSPLDLSDLWDIAGIGGFGDLSLPAVRAGDPPAASRRGGPARRHLRGHARVRRSRPPSLRLVRHVGRALRGAGGRRPGRARDQADRVPNER